MPQTKDKPAPNGWALVPFLFFIGLYLGVGMFLNAQGVELAFYQFPAPIAMSVAIILAMIMFKGTLNNKIDSFIRGIGQYEILYMCLIYLLAGAFASVSGAMGAVEATAQLGLSLISPEWIIVGIFVLTGFIATASGTSVGAIVTITPIAISLAEQSGSSLLYTLSAVMGGAMLGDNLSLISDTTIASSRTQGAKIARVFRQSARYALPSALIAMGLFFWIGETGDTLVTDTTLASPIKVIPYVLVFGMALSGINVMLTLVVGILVAGAIGVGANSFEMLDMGSLVWKGFGNMSEIFFLSLFTGGLSFMVIKEGGIEWLLSRLKRLIVGRKSAETTIALLSATSDMALANNTIAILMTGDVAKEIAHQHKIPAERSAALLDSFSCLVQGILPYGAQMLILTGFTAGAVSPLALLPVLFYQMVHFALISLSLAGLDIGFWQAWIFAPKNKNEK